jgi:outer membrane protein OmpA-like peptidoglycan-associated protein
MHIPLDRIVTALVAIAVVALLLAGPTLAQAPQNPTALVAQSTQVGAQNGPQSKVGQAPAAPVPTQSGGAKGQEIPNCEPLLQQFNEAVNTGQEEDAQRAVEALVATPMCGAYQFAAQRRLSAFRLTAVHSMMERDLPLERYERLLIAADRPQVLWQAAATMGEVRFGQRSFADAARAFDRAIEIVENEALTPIAPAKSDIESLFQRAAQARLLLAHVTANDRRAGFVEISQKRSDMLGGIYSPSVRGIALHTVIVPITFEYGKTTFTSVGEAAARELLTAMRQQQPARAILVGHTDIRGSAEFNLKLSRDRAEAVASFLRDNGVTTLFETAGKGSSEPVNLPTGLDLSQEEVYALNRRVEWQRE